MQKEDKSMTGPTFHSTEEQHLKCRKCNYGWMKSNKMAGVRPDWDVT